MSDRVMCSITQQKLNNIFQLFKQHGQYLSLGGHQPLYDPMYVNSLVSSLNSGVSLFQSCLEYPFIR